MLLPGFLTVNCPDLQQQCSPSVLRSSYRWSVYCVYRTRTQSFKNLGRIFSHARCHNQYRTRGLTHDSTSSLRTVHVWHDQIHQDEFRQITFTPLDGLCAVACNPRNLIPHRAPNEPAQQFSRHRRIVHDANSHSLASPIKLTTAWSNAS